MAETRVGETPHPIPLPTKVSERFEEWMLGNYPAPWRFEYVCDDAGPGAGDPYSAEPVIFDAVGDEVLDTRELDWGPSARLAFAEALVLLVNERSKIWPLVDAADSPRGRGEW